jgi:allophanate hydrolase
MGELIDRVRTAYRRIEAAERPEVWITLVPEEAALARAAAVEGRLAAGEDLPLAGATLAVKDNVDVAGLPTTAACPAFAYHPEVSAPAVAALEDAGCVVLGKTNMDQFATGLVGTRSPYGAVRNAYRPEYASGGSSSGSAVAVALGLVDLAIGTDTAGSGRVPAALNGVIGFKPSRGLIPTRGSVPACHSLDCLSVFAVDLTLGRRARDLMAGAAGVDRRPSGPRPGAPLRVGVVDVDGLDLDPSRQECWAKALAAMGLELAVIDVEPLLRAGQLLYGGALVAERYDAVGAFVDAHPADIDPVVGQIISAARDLPAWQLARDQRRIEELRQEMAAVWAAVDVIVVPTTTFAPTLAEVAADPIGVNQRLGRLTHGCNLLDLCAVALPAGMAADGIPFGVSVYGPAGADAELDVFAARWIEAAGVGASAQLEEQPSLWRPAVTVDGWEPIRRPATERYPVAVVGAHLSGQPLNWELTSRGGRLEQAGCTAAHYRLYALDTVPPKPGMVRDDAGGAAIEVEVWSLDAVGFAAFISEVARPLAIGPVELAGGRWVPGFVCQPEALKSAHDITAYGGWRPYRSATSSAEPTPLPT